MGLRQFKLDVTAAAGTPVDHVSRIRRGESEGEFEFTFTHERYSQPIQVKVLTPDVASYPESSSFMVFTDTDSLPQETLALIEDLAYRLTSKSIPQIVRFISGRLADDQEDRMELDSRGSSGDDEDIFDQSESEQAFDFDGPNDIVLPRFRDRRRKPGFEMEFSTESVERLKSALLKARQAGMTVGVVGEQRARPQSIFYVSYSVSQLGIPPETLEAWDLDVSEYLVLLLHCPSGYPTPSAFTQLGLKQDIVQFRFGKCALPCPERHSAASAFSHAVASERDRDPILQHSGEDVQVQPGHFQPMYLFESIANQLNDELAELIRIRKEHRVSWDEAQACLIARIRTSVRESANTPGLHNTGRSTGTSTPDSIDDDDDDDDDEGLIGNSCFSIPLIAMQFALRRLARCTEYCLVCHCRIAGGYEAVKPYVCPSQLCLFQYLTFGFGRVIEHEIIGQPYVVDLLVTFFMASIKMKRCREFPRGLNLMVPNLQHTGNIEGCTKMAVNFQTLELKLPLTDYKQTQQFRVGARLAIYKPTEDYRTPSPASTPSLVPRVYFICQIVRKEASILNFRIDKPVFVTAFNVAEMDSPRELTLLPSPGWREVDVALFDKDVDDLDEDRKSQALSFLGNLIPPVLRMRDFLLQNKGKRLRMWDALEPSAHTLLNWIVASNRSYIVQDEAISDVVQPTNNSSASTGSSFGPKVQGLGLNWMQFRLIQGSPEKEARFRAAIARSASSHGAGQPPAFFAWHGSNVANWHSIIRSGLDYRDRLHGRTFGDGIYLSPDFTVSLGYSGGNSTAVRATAPIWANSDLRPIKAISICEVVKDFPVTGASPHYVIKDIDRVQCRYMLVEVNPKAAALAQPFPKGTNRLCSTFVVQDSSHQLKHGETNVMIPKTNVPERLLPAHLQFASGSGDDDELIRGFGSDGSVSQSTGPSQVSCKRRRGSGASTPQRPSKLNSPIGLGKFASLSVEPTAPNTKTSVTAFVPGLLNWDMLPRMPEPSWAASDTRTLGRLNRDIKDLQEMQSNLPLQELGWYVNFDKLDNVFQWIVELHSFPRELPLARDMDELGCQSIVLELRFGNSYPMSPPFVRVVKPIFVEFARGGGGHVTAGGAICSELLTSSGWVPTLALDKVLLQVRLGMCDEERPARLHMSPQMHAYSILDAVQAFERAARRHGWRIPPDLKEIAGV